RAVGILVAAPGAITTTMAISISLSPTSRAKTIFSFITAGTARSRELHPAASSMTADRPTAAHGGITTVMASLIYLSPTLTRTTFSITTTGTAHLRESHPDESFPML